MDNIQKCNICTNVSLSQIFRKYYKVPCCVIFAIPLVFHLYSNIFLNSSFSSTEHSCIRKAEETTFYNHTEQLAKLLYSASCIVTFCCVFKSRRMTKCVLYDTKTSVTSVLRSCNSWDWYRYIALVSRYLNLQMFWSYLLFYYYVFFFFSWGETLVHLVLRPMVDLLYHPQMIDDGDCGAIGEMKMTG
jgi:hypothetical protein